MDDPGGQRGKRGDDISGIVIKDVQPVGGPTTVNKGPRVQLGSQIDIWYAVYMKESEKLLARAWSADGDPVGSQAIYLYKKKFQFFSCRFASLLARATFRGASCPYHLFVLYLTLPDNSLGTVNFRDESRRASLRRRSPCSGSHRRVEKLRIFSRTSPAGFDDSDS